EWFAAGAFGLVTVFTLLLRNVPQLQSNLLYNGLPGALVTALILGVHELGHIIVAKDAGIMLGVPYFVPSWQEGSPISINPLVIWAWAGLLINAINSIPAGELDGGRISFAIWGRKVQSKEEETVVHH
ncbi:unnamed protein product, partial [Linum tenue]